jgi:hypothetical protein
MPWRSILDCNIQGLNNALACRKNRKKNIDAKSIRCFLEQDIVPLQELVPALFIRPPVAVAVRDDIEWVHDILRITSYCGYKVVNLITIPGTLPYMRKVRCFFGLD